MHFGTCDLCVTKCTLGTLHESSAIHKFRAERMFTWLATVDSPNSMPCKLCCKPYILYFDDLDMIRFRNSFQAKTASKFIYNVWEHTNTMEDNNTGPREGQHYVFATNKMNRWRYYTRSAIYIQQ